MPDGNTMWEKIFDALNSSNIDVYPPAIKKGKCTSPYTVVKQEGSAQAAQYSSVYVYYSVMLYVPFDRYSQLSEYQKEVENALRKIYPSLFPLGQVGVDYYEDEIQAHMRTLMYRNNVRNRML